MTRTFDHIRGTAPLLLVREQPDLLPQLEQSWNREGGTTMPTSPMADQYSLTWKYEPYHEQPDGTINYTPRLRYRAEIKWARHAPALFRLIDPQQSWHRSRAIAIAVDALRKNEMTKRINRVRELYDEFKRNAASANESHEIGQVIREETRRYMHVNYDNIQKYIRDHIRSSLGGGGFKWRNAFEVTRHEWHQVYDLEKANLDMMDEHPEWYVANTPRSGERARSLDLRGLPTWFPSQSGWANVDFTRIILFGNHMSLYTLFIYDKAGWYTDVLNKVIDIIKPDGEYHFPYMEGGHIYRWFSDQHLTKVPFHAYDAKSWEAGVGLVVGPSINSFLAPVGGTAQLPSGESHTSMVGTVGSVVVTRHLPGKKGILGDDIAHYGNALFHGRIIEMDPDDTKYLFNLGLTFWHDALVPRITGPKPTDDRAADMRPITTPAFQEQVAVFGGRHSLAQRAAHAGMYLGQFGKGTLLERIEKQPPNEWKAPRELFEDLAQTGVEDAFRWAEERKIKDVFV